MKSPKSGSKKGLKVKTQVSAEVILLAAFWNMTDEEIATETMGRILGTGLAEDSPLSEPAKVVIKQMLSAREGNFLGEDDTQMVVRAAKLSTPEGDQMVLDVMAFLDEVDAQKTKTKEN